MGSRLMVGRKTLDLAIEVRILSSQLKEYKIMICPSCKNEDMNIKYEEGMDGDKKVWYCVLYCVTCGSVIDKWTEPRD